MNWKKISFTLAASVSLLGVGATAHAAQITTKEGTETQRAMVDITGDGTKDEIKFYEVRSQPTSAYSTSYLLEINDKKHKRLYTEQVPFGGYTPKLSFVDFTGDGVKDVYVSADTGGSSGATETYVASWNKKGLEQLPLPKAPTNIEGTFLPNYQVYVVIPNLETTKILDVSHHKELYDELGIYKEGKLVNPRLLLTTGYLELQPITTTNQGEYELKGTQKVTGSSLSDSLLYVDSTWKWNGEKWQLTNTAIHPSVNNN